MLLYLIKSGACMAIFLLFYKLLLENENMHVFKRFYLLGALVASLVIPNLVFVEYVEQVVVEEATTTPVIQSYTNIDVEQTTPATEMDMINYPLIFAMVYGLGLVVFGFRFFKNLFQIMRRIRKNTKLKVGFITKVLLQEKMSPHTFFKYVFLNKSKFETNTIPKEVLLHEETHAKQRHSLDVIFIEILQVILWFNPLVFFFKKSIKLNHEFLADQAVIKNDFDKTSYQNTLLSYLSPDSENRYQPQLANAINYSSIKKRFTIMKRETSKKAVLIRSLMLLPLLALMLYGFSQTKIEERKSTENNTTVINDINIEIESNGDLLVNNKTVLLADISKEIDRLNVSLEPYYIRNYVTANILYDESQVDLIDEIQVALQYAGISNIEHTSKRTANIVGRKGFRSSLYNGKTLDEARALRQEKVFDKIDSIEDDNRLLEIVWVDIKNENEIWFKNELTKLEDLNKNITSAYGNTLEKNNFIIQVNATDTLKSEFVDKINTE
ncbi:MAG: M56 family metallopeptidase, partial [Maribacter sp.]